MRCRGLGFLAGLIVTLISIGPGATPAQAQGVGVWPPIYTVVTALPATCRAGEFVFNTGSPVGVHQCIATNTWQQLASGTATGDAFVANPLSQFAATTSSQFKGVISDENAPDGASSKVLMALGSISIASGKQLTVSNSFTTTATDGSTVAFGPGGTVAYTTGSPATNDCAKFDASGRLVSAGAACGSGGGGGGDALVANPLSQFASTTSSQFKGVISDENAPDGASSKVLMALGSISIASGKQLTVSNSYTTTATDGSTVAFGNGGTVAYTGSYGTGVGTFLGTPSISNFFAALTGEGSGVETFLTTPSIANFFAALTGEGAGVETFLTTPSCSNFFSLVTGETGSGACVGGTAPTIDSAILTTKFNVPHVTALPGSPSAGDVVVVTDDSAAGACDSSAGSARTLCYYTGSAWAALGDGNTGGGGSPAGSNNYVQYNNSGSFGAEAAFAYNPSTNTLTVDNVTIGTAATIGGQSIASFTPAGGAAIEALTFNNNTGDVEGVTLASGVSTFWATPSIGNFFTALTGEASGAGTFLTTASVANFFALLTGEGTGVETALGTNTNASDGIMTPNGSATVTNKTISGSSNTISAIALSSLASQSNNTVNGNWSGSSGSPTANSTIPLTSIYVWTAGVCQGSTASLGVNLPTSNPASAVCKTGSNTNFAVAQFTATGQSFQIQVPILEAVNTTTFNVKGQYMGETTSTGNTVFTLGWARVAAGSTLDPSFTDCTITDAAGTANQKNDFTQSCTFTSLAAGDLLMLKFTFTTQPTTSGNQDLLNFAILPVFNKAIGG